MLFEKRFNTPLKPLLPPDKSVDSKADFISAKLTPNIPI